MASPLFTSLAACLALAPQSNWWFDPMKRFGPMSEKYPRTAAKPLLLVLPGLDGSGITAWTQFPELALDYELRAMQIPADDRTSYEALVDLVAKEVNDEKDNNRDVLLFGESMGAGVALDAARRAPPSALVLCSPATGWDRTWLGKLRFWLVTLPDALLGLIVAFTSYQLFDLQMMTTTAQRIVSGEKAAILDTPERIDYAWRVVKEMPSAFASPPSTVRHRVEKWAQPSIDAGRDLSDLNVPMLIVAGTADIRVPAEEEARRLARIAPPECRAAVHLVESAGHAGATDERLDLRAVLQEWRSEQGA